MRDAIGGVVNLVIIVVFMVIVSGYLAFNVNYTKAFRVKNKIISSFEQYEGNCTVNGSACMNQIVTYMKQIGYDTNQNFCDNSGSLKGYKCINGFGYLKVEGVKDSTSSHSYSTYSNDRTTYYYKIVTQIKIDLPIINRVMQGMNTFKVTGDTKTFVVNE